MGKHYPVTLGACLVFIGAWALAGNMGIATAFAFSSTKLGSLAVLATGFALLFGLAASMQRRGQIVLGLTVLSIAVISTVPGLLDLEKGSLSYTETLAIALLGFCLVAIHISKLPGMVVHFALLIMVAIGMFGLACNSLNLAIFLSVSGNIRVDSLIAIALLAGSLGIWLQSYGMTWHQHFYADGDDKKISLISGVILLSIALSAGLVGFILMAKTTQAVLSDSLMISLEHRARAFEANVNQGFETARLAATRPRFNILLAKHAQQGISETEFQEIQKILDDIIKNTPIKALIVYDGQGKVIGKRGQLIVNPPFMAPLTKLKGTQLLWKDVTVLRAHAHVMPKGDSVGLLVADIPLPKVDELFRDFAGFGESGSMGVCAAKGGGILCLPSRGNGYKIKVIPRTFEGIPVPMSFALDGKTGVVTAPDRNGENVISAHTPLGSLGLGMIVKISAAELYQAVKQQLGYTLGAIVALVVMGIVLLRWQITPLARNLVAEIGQRRLAQERFSHLAHHDSLTGLPNRVLFHERMQAVINNKSQQLAAVMFLDADRFKNINDTLGHEAGDQLLTLIASRLTTCLRVGDTVSRFAGDEFALILPGLEDADQARQFSQCLSESFSQPFIIKEQPLFITASIGVTLYPTDASTVEGLLKNADMAMYRAKDTGRNNIQFYSADMHAQALKRLMLENHLRSAVARGELVLHYQPMVDAKSGRICAMEALLRWNHRDLGMVAPMDFIPMAEESGLIIPIGEWVLRTACAQARAWQDAGLGPLRLAVNLSARQFQKDITSIVASVLEDTGLEPHYLELELTETVVMQNAETAVDTLDALDCMGVALSIDDFGTGYSSLSYLKRFPIDTLKIDRSFVRDIPLDVDDMLITTAIINLAHSLGIQVVAEGVETLAQLAFLKDQQCDVMQGFHFSKPLPIEAFEQLVREHNAPKANVAELLSVVKR